MPTPSIERRELQAQPVLFVRRTTPRQELPAAIGACLGAVHAHCQKAGLALAGPPFVRYTTMDAGGLTIEGGLPLAAAAPGGDGVEAGTLPGGPAAVALHCGSYDTLQVTYTALERWLEAHSAQAAGAPWESYLTDPGEHPNPDDWRTEIFWPLVH
jgi:effector-binding domain-containing protein